MFYVCTAFKWKNNLNFNKIFDRLIKIWLYFHLMQAYIKHKCFSPWSLWDFPSIPHFLYYESSFQRLWFSFWAIYWLRLLDLSYWHYSEREGGEHMWLCWTYGCYIDTGWCRGKWALPHTCCHVTCGGKWTLSHTCCHITCRGTWALPYTCYHL